MIPSDWIPHRRPGDRESVGYLVPSGDLFVPVTVFGHPLADARDYVEAEEILEEAGLRYLAEPWLLRGEDGEADRRVVINEVSPDRIVVANVDFANLVDDEARLYAERTVLPVPTDRLMPA